MVVRMLVVGVVVGFIFIGQILQLEMNINLSLVLMEPLILGLILHKLNYYIFFSSYIFTFSIYSLYYIFDFFLNMKEEELVKVLGNQGIMGLSLE